MKQLLLVFVGGGFGSVLRFIMGKYLNTDTTAIPWGTFTANVLGSLIVGVILGIAMKNNSISQSQMLLLVVGFCGGFTTFSGFASENFTYLKQGDLIHFGLYTLGSIIVGFSAVFAGVYLARSI